MELKEMAARYADLRTRRIELERMAKDVAAREDEMKASIINTMGAGGLRTVNIEGVGRLSLKSRRRYEISDQDAYATLVASNIIEALEKGHPAADCPLFQMRVAVGNMDEYLSRQALDNDREERYLADHGIRKVDEPSLVFTRTN